MTTIDTASAARFLAALTGDHDHTFQTFDEPKSGRRGLTRVLYGSLDRHARTLVALNEKGAGIFFMVNRGDQMGRKAANVTACRALFLDLDGSPIEPVMAAAIPPRIVVESSPGKWHAYWPIADLPPDQFTPAQKTLAALFAGDPKVHDRPRVMRLPGFLHRKGTPFASRLVHADPAPLTWQEMVEAFGLAQRMTLPSIIPKGQRNNMLFKLARTSAAGGIPEAEQVKRALQVNAERCAPEPLTEAEVRAVVASAYREPQTGAVAVPLAVVDSPAYKSLDDSARTLLMLAYRKANSFNDGRLVLPWSELREWFPREKTFGAVRKRVVQSGLLSIAKPAKRAMPRRGRGPEPHYYRLAIPPFSAPYSNARIPPVGAHPEAFQALADSSEKALGRERGSKSGGEA